MSKLIGLVGAILGWVVFTSPCVAQNAPWPPPAGMSAGEYLQRYGRLYNPYTGGDPRRVDPELYRALPQPPRESTPPTSALGSTAAGSNPSAGLRIRGELTAAVSKSATEALGSHGTRLISP
jgi:hypothetical protein